MGAEDLGEIDFVVGLLVVLDAGRGVPEDFVGLGLVGVDADGGEGAHAGAVVAG